MLRLWGEKPKKGTVVYGVSSAVSGGAGKAPGAKFWTYSKTLIAWREAGEHIVEEELRVTKQLTEYQLSTYVQEKAIADNALVALRLELQAPEEGKIRQATLIEILKPVSDPDLQNILDAYRTPVIVEHENFGNLILNRAYNWFEGQIVWLDKNIDLSLSISEGHDVGQALSVVEVLYSDASGWISLAKACASEKLLKTWNEHWREEDEAIKTHSDFVALLTLNTISVEPEGTFTFWFSDEEYFFGGHDIQVYGTLDDGFKDAHI